MGLRRVGRARALCLLGCLAVASIGPIWCAAAQDCPETANWTWMKGASTTGQSGIYGTRGTPAAANTPGARAFGVSWTDPSGARWLFGGYNGSRLNDLWKCDPATGYWAWMKGASAGGQSGTYGTRGTPNPANTPGARTDAASWTDHSGNLWLFGGYGFDGGGIQGRLNDLWKYDRTTGNWTWVKGSAAVSQSGVYGTLGTPAATNTPGCRQAAVSWTDASGKLWLFGGANGSYYNDLWNYDPLTGYWTWMKGAPTTNQSGIYGVPETPAAANTPGARYDAASWGDVSGKLWVFGGYGYDRAGSLGRLNDLWNYEPATGSWTWAKGSSTINPAGIYGTLGSPAMANTPGPRTCPVSWTDASGNLWLLGGAGSSGFLNDLWEFVPATGNWTWVKGASTTDQSGTYGTLGTPAAANKPGARCQAVSWTDASGDLWLFGGYNGSYFNDLWRARPFVLDSTPPVITLLGSSSVAVECHASYSDAGATANDNCDGNLTAGIVTTNPVNTSMPGPHTVTYDVTDGNGNPAIQVARTVNVVDTVPPVITLLGADPTTVECHASYSDAGATANDNCDGNLTAGIVTTSAVNTSAPGAYTVTYGVTDGYGNPAVQIARTVSVVDTTRPVITLLGANPVTVECHASHTDAGATAMDACAGNRTANIVVSNPVNMDTPGVYTVTYDVDDGNGNHAVQVRRIVNVLDTTPPVITLLGANPVTVERHGTYTDAGATAADTCAGDRTANIVTGNTVNVDTPGVYTVTYDVTDGNGNSALRATRTVNVVDTPPPQTYAISYTANPPAGGALAGPDSIIAGGTATVTVIANSGYDIASVSASNGNVTSSAPYVLSNVTADATVTATFVPRQTLVAVPDVSGMPVGQAQATLGGAGLTFSVTERSSDTVPVGRVISQEPPAGIQVAAGTLVGLTVSSGPENFGCACSRSKDVAPFIKIRRTFGDLFLGGLSLMALLALSRRRT